MVFLALAFFFCDRCGVWEQLGIGDTGETGLVFFLFFFPPFFVCGGEAGGDFCFFAFFVYETGGDFLLQVFEVF